MVGMDQDTGRVLSFIDDAVADRCLSRLEVEHWHLYLLDDIFRGFRKI